MATVTYITKINDTVSRIAYQKYGSNTNRQIEQIIEANPGLEEEGILLTPGMTIVLPNIAVTSTQPRILPQIKLWD